MSHVPIEPGLLHWACERARAEPASLAERFPQLPAWERGERQPTLRQLEAFAKATHTPVGLLLLPEPPEERLPIPDFRTIADEPIGRPSVDLLDTLYLCRQRQVWYADFARMAVDRPLAFVGSAHLTHEVEAVAEDIRGTLGFSLEERRRLPTWTDALRRFIEQADAAGVLVMVSGVVGSNNRRKLDPGEFRGFALVDDLAPLVFINGADTKAAQMFTLAHELAHVWLGESALSDSEARHVPAHEVERWCNLVAAEVLAPLAILREELAVLPEGGDTNGAFHDELNRLARRFKVSTLVVLRRIRDAGALAPSVYRAACEAELERLRGLSGGVGGNFYLTLGARVSKRFARTVVVSTLEGQTSFTEAFRLLGFRKMETFRKLGANLGVIP